MAQKLLFILTEGFHDSAFIYRILKSEGFQTDNRLIRKYPKPLNDFLLSDLLNVSIPEVRLQEARSRFLPSYVMQKDEDLILIYSVGGESKSDIRISLIKTLNALNEPDEDAIQAIPNTEISVLYFFDADQEGTEKRMNQIIDECKKVFTKIEFDKKYDSEKYHLFEDIQIGAFIFKEPSSDQGMLEDVLIPLMKEDNNDIFDEANRFLEINRTCNLFSSKLKYDEDGKTILKVGKSKYYYKKSLIGTVGQLQKSGKSNTVCISDTDYLNNEKIKNNETCKKIIEKIKEGLK